jgi:hypothetical protein
MDASQNSLHLLSHFDDAPAVAAAVEDVFPSGRPTRGVGWVLRWSTALVALCYSTIVLTEFAYCLAAEQILARAARAGVLEATLPRASVRSVEQSVWRRLEGREVTQGEVKISLLQNGVVVSKKLRPRGGDEFSIRLVMPAQAMMPGWLRTLTSWRGEINVEGRAERILPGRKLIARATTGGTL